MRRAVPSSESDFLSLDIKRAFESVRESHVEDDPTTEDPAELLFALVSSATEFFEYVALGSRTLRVAFSAFLGLHSQFLGIFSLDDVVTEESIRNSFWLFRDRFLSFSSMVLPVNFSGYSDHLLVLEKKWSDAPFGASICNCLSMVLPQLTVELENVTKITDVDEFEAAKDRIEAIRMSVMNVFHKSCAAVPTELTTGFVNLSYGINVWHKILRLRDHIMRLDKCTKKRRFFVEPPESAQDLARFADSALRIVEVQMILLKVEHACSGVNDAIRMVSKMIGIMKVRWEPCIIDMWKEFCENVMSHLNTEIGLVTDSASLQASMDMKPEVSAEFLKLFDVWTREAETVSGAGAVLQKLSQLWELERGGRFGVCVRRAMHVFARMLLIRKAQEDCETIMVLLLRLHHSHVSKGSMESVRDIVKCLAEARPNIDVVQYYLLYMELMIGTQRDDFMEGHPSADVFRKLCETLLSAESREIEGYIAQLAFPFAKLEGNVDVLADLVPFIERSHKLATQYISRMRLDFSVQHCIQLVERETGERPPHFNLRTEFTDETRNVYDILKYAAMCLKYRDQLDPANFKALSDSAIAVSCGILYEDFMTPSELCSEVENLGIHILVPHDLDIIRGGFVAMEFFDSFRRCSSTDMYADYQALKERFHLFNIVPDSCHTAFEDIPNAGRYRQMIEGYVMWYTFVQGASNFIASSCGAQSISMGKKASRWGVFALVKWTAEQSITIVRSILGDDVFQRIMDMRVEQDPVGITDDDKQRSLAELMDEIFRKLDCMGSEVLTDRFGAVKHLDAMARRSPTYEVCPLMTVMKFAVRAMTTYVHKGDHFLLSQLLTLLDDMRNEAVADEELALFNGLKAFLVDVRSVWLLQVIACYSDRGDVLTEVEGMVGRVAALIKANDISNAEIAMTGVLEKLTTSQLQTLPNEVTTIRKLFMSQSAGLDKEIAARREETSQLRNLRFAEYDDVTHTIPTDDLEEAEVMRVRTERDDLYAGTEMPEEKTTLNSVVTMLLEDAARHDVSMRPIHPQAAFASFQLSDAMKTASLMRRGLRTLRFSQTLTGLRVRNQIAALCELESAQNRDPRDEIVGPFKVLELRDLQHKRDQTYAELVREIHGGRRSAARNGAQISELLKQLNNIEAESSASAKISSDVHARYLAATNELYQYVTGDISALQMSIARLEKATNETKDKRASELHSLLGLSGRSARLHH